MKKIIVLLTLGILLGASLAFAAQKTFLDVPANSWYTDAVNSLSAKNIISGYPDGTFKPNKSVNRAEVAVMLDQMIKYLENNSSQVEAKTGYRPYNLTIKELEPNGSNIAHYNISTYTYFIDGVPVQTIGTPGAEREIKVNFYAKDKFNLKIIASVTSGDDVEISQDFTYDQLKRSDGCTEGEGGQPQEPGFVLANIVAEVTSSRSGNDKFTHGMQLKTVDEDVVCGL